MAIGVRSAGMELAFSATELVLFDVFADFSAEESAFLPQAVRDTMPTAKTRVNNKEIILFIILLLNLLHIGTVNPVTVL